MPVLAGAADKTRVIVLKQLPTATSYGWSVAGKASTNCYSSGCSSTWSAPSDGKDTVQGAELKLLLPDGRIVIATCSAKPDMGRNLGLALLA
jgi:hypothetical protein